MGISIVTKVLTLLWNMRLHILAIVANTPYKAKYNY